MEWLDSLWAWVMSLIASLFALFGVSSVSEASRSVEALHVPTDPSSSEASMKAAEVFEALAAQVSPMMVELPVATEGDAPSNM
jgi:hypothetical protein